MEIKIKFDSSTDYEAAEILIKRLYSDLVSSSCNCNCKNNVACKITALILAININKIDNVGRWKQNIETAYKLLKSNCKC